MRLVTRSDFDGLACAALLEELGLVDEVFYTHPKDIQDGRVPITSNDILANVPLVQGCGLWFDHHSSELERNEIKGKFKGSSDLQPSAARVIYNYYINDHADKLKKFADMLVAVDKADSAQYTTEDILEPKGWMMLAFIADPRTGLGYHHTFRLSNFELMKSLPSLLRTRTIEDILNMPDFQERVQVYLEETRVYKQFIIDHSKVSGKAIIIDLRGVKEIPSGNRFIEYTLYPEQNVSIRLADGKNREFVMVSMGHSIINRSAMVDVGSLMLKYGGGGHQKVGTCQVPYDRVDETIKDLLTEINR